MSWSSIIFEGAGFFLFIFLIFKKRFLVGSRQCQIQGGGFLKNIFTQRYKLQRQMSGDFFFQLVSKLMLMGSPWTSIFYHPTSLWVESNLECNLCGSILVSL